DDGEGPRRPARRRAPFPPQDDGEGQGGERDGRDREQLDPEERGERVVDERVGDEAVAARVPEVVPEREAVLEEHGALVRVRREVRAGRAEPRERGGDAPRRSSREGRFADEWVAEGHRSCGTGIGNANRRSTGTVSVRWTSPPSTASSTASAPSITGPAESFTRSEAATPPSSATATARSARSRAVRAAATAITTNGMPGTSSHHW